MPDLVTDEENEDDEGGGMNYFTSVKTAQKNNENVEGGNQSEERVKLLEERDKLMEEWHKLREENEKLKEREEEKVVSKPKKKKKKAEKKTKVASHAWFAQEADDSDYSSDEGPKLRIFPPFELAMRARDQCIELLWEK